MKPCSGTINAAQVISARKLLGWSPVRLAGRANMGEHRLRRFEAGLTTLNQHYRAEVERALREAGIEFGADGEEVRLCQETVAPREGESPI
jgi:ribosome-binding protein aMBF1 (putative translation factor)